jgi:hypothetical protein
MRLQGSEGDRELHWRCEYGDKKEAEVKVLDLWVWVCIK